jgi:hypothetical protein
MSGASTSKRTPPQLQRPAKVESVMVPSLTGRTRVGRLPRVPAAGDYEYELRRDGAVIATGRIQLDEPPSPGDELALGSKRTLVEDVLPLAGRRRLILQQA